MKKKPAALDSIAANINPVITMKNHSKNILPIVLFIT